MHPESIHFWGSRRPLAGQRQVTCPAIRMQSQKLPCNLAANVGWLRNSKIFSCWGGISDLLRVLAPAPPPPQGAYEQ
eukprot:5270026-Pyramimonas_sp.AAC.1